MAGDLFTPAGPQHPGRRRIRENGPAHGPLAGWPLMRPCRPTVIILGLVALHPQLVEPVPEKAEELVATGEAVGAQVAGIVIYQGIGITSSEESSAQ